MSNVLVTGAAGYIGSHACVALLDAGHDVIGIDNFSNSSPVAVGRIEEVSGRPIAFVEGDLLDRSVVAELFAATPIDAVMHFAGRKAVGESTEHPLRYYQNNVAASVNLVTEMAAHQVYKIVFSSSCTVYGDPESVPVHEGAALRPVSPYGRSKRHVEELLMDLHASDERWRVAILRYFNPIGAHPSGRLGENPTGRPDNLMPHVMRAALGTGGALQVFGGDYPTPDGTCVRDYVHVVDLVEAHVLALEHITGRAGVHTLNLGTGTGVSVLELVEAVERTVGVEVPCDIVDRRPGDAVALWADPSRAAMVLGWVARRSVVDMCLDHYAFHQAHPHGYDQLPTASV
jgi:UDP-glucose 4-epimerase